METPVIGFWGGMALLISSITGPGLTTIPLLFQEAGWFTPTISFLLFGAIAGAVSLFLVEAMSTIQGNESFQAKVEYSTVAHLYLGDKPHLIMQGLLYLALQSVNVSSIIISEQTMDSLLIRLFNKTCALSFTQGWVCVSEISPAGSPFDSYILFSFGYLISAAMVLPLSVMSLVQNIKFQLVSVVILFFVMSSWVFIFAKHGFELPTPAIGSNQGNLVGVVLNNFAFITTVPSFINELSRSISIHRVIGYSILTCVVMYLTVGLTGAASFQLNTSSDILATLSASNQNRVLVTIVNILFPVAVLVTSVPVFAIVIRYNLVRGNVCSNRHAIWWASLAPWLLIIPFQTKGWLILVMNWASLIFGSSTNFIIPLLLYISSKTFFASTAEAGDAGNIFVLHRDDSSASRHSHRRSTQSTRSIPRIITTLESGTSLEEEDIGATSAVDPFPQLLVQSSSHSRRNSYIQDPIPPKVSDGDNESNDLADFGEQASRGNLDASVALRVIYSPSVSREPSIGHSHRPSFTSNRTDETTRDGRPPELDRESSETSAIARISTVRSRQNSTTTNMSRSSQASHRGSIATPMSPSNQRTEALEIDEENASTPTFVAFPRIKWLNSILIPKIALGIVTSAVLGNLVYTIIETAKGNNPVSS